MRWQAPTERTQQKLMLPILILLAIGSLPFVLFVRLHERWFQRQRRKGWHGWFAWRPVRLGPYRSDPWAWFERVDRCAADIRNEFVYRVPGGMT